MDRATRRAAVGALLAFAATTTACGSGERAVRDLPAYRPPAVDNTGTGDATTRALPDRPTLDDYVAYAMRESPALRAAYYAWIAARERSPQASVLPNPRITYGYYFREVETRVGGQRQAERDAAAATE